MNNIDKKYNPKLDVYDNISLFEHKRQDVIDMLNTVGLPKNDDKISNKKVRKKLANV